ncbi:unnamed protein product, partial [Oppiella nova]
MNINPTNYEPMSDFPKQLAQKLMDCVVNENKEYDIILDIGCGTGRETELLAQRVTHRRVVGVDIDPQMVEFADREHKSVDTIEYWTVDMSLSWDELPDRIRRLEGRVSLVFSNGALQFIRNADQLMAVLRRLLAPNGVIMAHLLATPDVNALLSDEQKREYGLRDINSRSVAQQLNVWRDSCLANGIQVVESNVFQRVFHLNSRKQIGIDKYRS